MSVRPSVVVNISHFDCLPNRPYITDLYKNCVYGILCKTMTMNVFALMRRQLKGIMSLSLEFLLKVLICVEVNIYLHNMSIKRVFRCFLSTSIIKYACPNFRTTCTTALMLTLQHAFELSTLPSIPSNCHVDSLC